MTILRIALAAGDVVTGVPTSAAAAADGSALKLDADAGLGSGIVNSRR